MVVVGLQTELVLQAVRVAVVRVRVMLAVQQHLDKVMRVVLAHQVLLAAEAALLLWVLRVLAVAILVQVVQVLQAALAALLLLMQAAVALAVERVRAVLEVQVAAVLVISVITLARVVPVAALTQVIPGLLYRVLQTPVVVVAG